jgi:hypothetical protein
MKKKNYQAPKVERVQLKVSNAILADCHSSPNMQPANAGGIPGPCLMSTGCYTPPI